MVVTHAAAPLVALAGQLGGRQSPRGVVKLCGNSRPTKQRLSVAARWCSVGKMCGQPSGPQMCGQLPGPHTNGLTKARPILGVPEALKQTPKTRGKAAIANQKVVLTPPPPHAHAHARTRTHPPSWCRSRELGCHLPLVATKRTTACTCLSPCGGEGDMHSCGAQVVLSYASPTMATVARCRRSAASSAPGTCPYLPPRAHECVCVCVCVCGH